MCVFLVTNNIKKFGWYLNDQRFKTNIWDAGAPDGTTVTVHEDVTFVHGLLSMTGDHQKQPYETKDHWFLLSGQIYDTDDEFGKIAFHYHQGTMHELSLIHI